MKDFFTQIKVLLGAGVIFGLLVAAPFLAIAASIIIALIAAWLLAKILFSDFSDD